MMKNIINYFWVYIILFAGFLSAVPSTVNANPKFQFSSDYTAFRYNDSYIIELYCSFYQKGLKYVFTDGTYEAAGLLDIMIINKKNNEIYFTALNKVPTKTSDTTGTYLEQKIVVQKNIPVISGEYIMKIIGKDFNDTLYCDSSSVFDISIPEYSATPQVSGIQLSSKIAKSEDKESSYYKYGFEVIPNPSNLFGNKMNLLFYYCELYGFQSDLVSEDFLFKSRIENINREVLISKEKKINKTSIVMIDSYKIDSLPTGSYFLVISVKDSLKSIDIKMEKKFYIFNSHVQGDISQSDETNFLRSEYTMMKEEQVEDEYAKTIYIRTTQETQNYGKLKSLEDKRKFLFDFWKTRDTDPSTFKNEFKISYFTRIIEANSSFKQSFTEGWKTDRGRIYIIYGKPNDIERFPFEAETKSYEIWHYDEIEGRAICVFIELQQTGSGDYTLVHSTLRKELRNDNWKEIIKK